MFLLAAQTLPTLPDLEALTTCREVYISNDGTASQDVAG
jgi:hypothetical protein